MSKKIFLVAMSEVQEDVIVTDAEVTDNLLRAEKMAREFMLERVGDFFGISKDNHEDREGSATLSVRHERGASETFCGEVHIPV